VLVTVMDKDRLADYQTMTAELRKAGIRAEMFLGGGNMAKQLKYADKRACPVAVIEGGNEKEAGVVQLKDLALGARLAALLEAGRRSGGTRIRGVAGHGNTVRIRATRRRRHHRRRVR